VTAVSRCAIRKIFVTFVGMIEFLKELFEASRQRLKSPILGTYSLYFILYNWRPFVFLLFSKASIEDKIVVINSEYVSCNTFLWPAILTIIATFVIPYLMWFVDICLGTAKKFRVQIKHKEYVSKLNNEIEIATKEFEIQNRKSGTRTIETLQATIDVLEKEKLALTSSHNSERENNVKEIQRLNELLRHESEKNSTFSTDESIVFSETVFDTYNYLESSQKLKEYFEYFDAFSKSLNLDDATVSFYRNLELAYYGSAGYIYTKLGYEVYHFLFEINIPKETKKKMDEIRNKLNNHELKMIEKFPSDKDKPFSIPDGFRESIRNEMIDSGFLLNIVSEKFVLSKNGIAFRNLIGLDAQ